MTPARVAIFEVTNLVLAVFCFAWAAYFWRQCKVVGSRAFTVFLLAVAGYLIANLLISISPPALAALAFSLRWTGLLLAALLLLIFVIQYTGQAQWLAHGRLLALGAPALVCLVLIWANALHHWLWVDVLAEPFGALATVESSGGALAWLPTLVVAGYSLGTIVCAAGGVRRARLGDRGRTAAILVGLLAPAIAILFILARPLALLPNTIPPLLLGLTALIPAWVLLRYRYFYLTALIHETLMGKLVDGMLALDSSDSIVDINPPMQALLGMTRERAIGRPLAALSPDVCDAVQRARSAAQGAAELVHRQGTATRHFDVQAAPLSSAGGEQVGSLLILYDITPRVQAEAALRASEAQLRAVIDHSPQAIVVFDTAGRIVLWSAAAERMYGWTAAEMMGSPLPPAAAEWLSQRSAFHDRVNLGESVSFTDIVRIRKDGAAIHTSLSVSPLINAAGQVYGQLSISTDISERIRIEQALRESEEHYRQLLENMPVPVAIYSLEDDRNRILYINQIAFELWKAFGPFDLSSITIWDIIPQNEQTMVDEIIVSLKAGKVFGWFEEHLIAPNGELLTVLISSSRVTYHGEMAAMVVIDDITELTRTQAELRQREHALTLLQERERLGRELHDGLGQALGYLNVQSQATQILLAEGQIDAATANLLQMTHVAQETQANLRSHILGLRTPAPPQRSFRQTLEGMLHQFSTACGIEAALNMSDDAPQALFLPAVEEQVLRIIQEALANVRKHASAHTVEIDFSFLATETQIVVKDNGVGFDPAQHLPAGPDARSFGLQIMRERAEQIGARLDVQSAPGSGVKVWLHVPTAAANTIRPQISDLAILQNIRVLLVDDHPLFLDGMRTLLRARGITVVGMAANGLEAQELVRSLHPDVVVMDVEMPACSGVEATLRIKSEFPAVKIIMLTVSESEDDLFAALRNGASGYLLKSLDANQFCQYLVDVMRGEIPLPPTLAAHVLGAWSSLPTSGAVDPQTALTPQQWTILNLVAQGKLYKEVAAEMRLSERTIKYHLGQILDRLQVSTREQAIAFARQTTNS